MNVHHTTRIATVLLVATLVGCGSRTYERELENTGRWYAYLARLDAKLGTPWKGGSVEYFRPPKGFTPKFGGDDPSEKTPFTPEFLGSGFEGLQVTWRKSMSSTRGNAEGYVLVFDNHDLWLSDSDKERRSAGSYLDRFDKDVRRYLEPTVDGAELPSMDTWQKIKLPVEGGFGPERTLRLVTANVPPEEDRPAAVMRLYVFDEGDIQGAVMFLEPENASNSDQLAKNAALAVETLETMKKAPALGTSSSSTSPKKKSTGGPTVPF